MRRTIRIDGLKTSQEKIDKALEEAWSDLRENENLREELRAKGVNLDVIDAAVERQFTAEPAQGVDGVSVFVLQIAAPIAAHYAMVGIDAFWTKAIWPALKRRYGSSIKEETDDAS